MDCLIGFLVKEHLTFLMRLSLLIPLHQILKLKVKKTDMSVRLRSMNLSTKTLNMSMIALLRRLNARRRIMILKVVFKSVICPS